MDIESQLCRDTNASDAVQNAEYVCWSRMQAEAGQELESIVARKEFERRAGDGIFFWGVGNAPAAAARALARTGKSVPVIFSIMKTRPKLVDSSPGRVVVWRHYVDIDGRERPLPNGTLVTSRGDSSSGPKLNHNALMCRSETPLQLGDFGLFDPSAYRNAGEVGGPVGASQVTALLRATGSPNAASFYRINLAAWLAGAFWVRLTDPVELPTTKLLRLSSLPIRSIDEWLEMTQDLREGLPGRHLENGGQHTLL